MSYMFEVYYKAPANPRKEAELAARVSKLSGHLTFREDPNGTGPQSICLTFEFDKLPEAEAAANALRTAGEHVEGPCEYGEGPFEPLSGPTS